MAILCKFRIVGISPLLVHNPAGMRPGSEAGLGTKRIPTPEEEAKAGLYVNDKGEFFVRANSFRSAIIGKGGSASGRKIGKRTANQCVAAGFFIQHDEAILTHPDTGKPLKEYRIDSRRAVVQGNGIVRSRPCFDRWATTITCEIDEDFIRKDQILELLKIAGKISGVGDYRPQCKGMFGRFDAELLTK